MKSVRKVVFYLEHDREQASIDDATNNFIHQIYQQIGTE